MRHDTLHRLLNHTPLCLLTLGPPARFRRYRQWQGGHWERWYCEPVHADLWLHVEECYHAEGRRPGACFGIPECEQW